MTRERSLLGSAKEFLVEALTNYGDGKHKFAIVHAVTAAELILKERLARIHPVLIRRNIDAAHVQREHTAALGVLPQRLLNLGVPMQPSDLELIARCAEWRNQIVHHMPTFDEAIAERQLPLLLDFLASFLRRELGAPLGTFMPKRLSKIALRLLKEWQATARSAVARAASEGHTLPYTCPQCGAAEVLCLREDKRVHCHLCHTDQYLYDECDECGRTTVGSVTPTIGENVCDACIDAAGDRYLSMASDIERGR